MVSIPLLFPTLAVLGVVLVEWNHTRVVALIALAASFVLLVAVLCHPAFSAEEIVAYGRELLVTPLAIARVVGAFCFMYTVVRVIRAHQIPW